MAAAACIAAPAPAIVGSDGCCCEARLLLRMFVVGCCCWLWLVIQLKLCWFREDGVCVLLFVCLRVVVVAALRCRCRRRVR